MDHEVSQVARLSEACAVYAPLYRQVTIGTYFTNAERRESFQAAAFWTSSTPSCTTWVSTTAGAR